MKTLLSLLIFCASIAETETTELVFEVIIHQFESGLLIASNADTVHDIDHNICVCGGGRRGNFFQILNMNRTGLKTVLGNDWRISNQKGHLDEGDECAQKEAL